MLWNAKGLFTAAMLRLSERSGTRASEVAGCCVPREIREIREIRLEIPQGTGHPAENPRVDPIG